jgi:hypothetical protein
MSVQITTEIWVKSLLRLVSYPGNPGFESSLFIMILSSRFSDGTRSFSRLGSGWNDNIKVDLKDIEWKSVDRY